MLERFLCSTFIQSTTQVQSPQRFQSRSVRRMQTVSVLEQGSLTHLFDPQKDAVPVGGTICWGGPEQRSAPVEVFLPRSKGATGLASLGIDSIDATISFFDTAGIELEMRDLMFVHITKVNRPVGADFDIDGPEPFVGRCHRSLCRSTV